MLITNRCCQQTAYNAIDIEDFSVSSHRLPGLPLGFSFNLELISYMNEGV